MDTDRGAVPAVVAPPPGNPRFPLFDSLRAIAALSVFLAHSIAIAELTGDVRKYSGELSRTGVCLFFLVSGFLLYRPFVAARWSGAAPMRLRDFARRRLLRIVPAYWLALGVVVAYYGVGVNSDNWLVFPAFGQIYRSETFEQGIGPAWTLCVEMSFYLLLPLYAWVARRLSARSDSPRADIALLTLLATASLAFHAHYAGQGEYKIASTLPGTFYWFALGMGLALASVAMAPRQNPPALIRIVHRRPSICWLLALCAFLLLLSQHEGSAYSGSVKEYALCGVVALFMLLPAVFGDDEGGLPRRILSWPALAWMGLVSYGIYLWHAYVIQYVNNSSLLDPLARHYVLFVALSLAATAAIAGTSYYFLERPILRLKRSRRSGALAWAATLLVGIALLAGVALAASGTEAEVACRIPQPSGDSARPTPEPTACRPQGFASRAVSVSGRRIRLSGGGHVPVVPGHVRGHIDVMQPRGANVEIIGWAASYRQRRPADAILIFADGRFVAAVAPTRRRPDVSEAAGLALDGSGFQVDVPMTVLRPHQRASELRLFGAASGAASELHFDCKANPAGFPCNG
jgi:peptidoglycan/LPS O-acetylase OafA/YrhL